MTDDRPNDEDDQRRALHAFLTPEAHDGFVAFSDQAGVSVSGIIEAIGQRFSAQLGATGTAEADAGLVRAGRKIDAVRRRRGGRPART